MRTLRSLLILAAAASFLSCAADPKEKLRVAEGTFNPGAAGVLDEAPRPTDPAAFGAHHALPGLSPLAGYQRRSLERFGRDDLYKLLDGGAGEYLDCGYDSAATATYRSTRAGDAAFTATAFRMNSPLAAFCVFAPVRAHGGERIYIGDEAYIRASEVVFRRGRYMVQLFADAEGGEAADQLLLLAKQSAAAIPEQTGDSLPPVSDLPPQGIDESSVRYQPRAVLGHEFLPGGAYAIYRLGGASVTALIVPFPSGEEAGLGFERLSASYRAGRPEQVNVGPYAPPAPETKKAKPPRGAKKVEVAPPAPPDPFKDLPTLRSAPPSGPAATIVLVGRHIVGVTGPAIPPQADALLREMFAKLAPGKK